MVGREGEEGFLAWGRPSSLCSRKFPLQLKKGRSLSQMERIQILALPRPTQAPMGILFNLSELLLKVRPKLLTLQVRLKGPFSRLCLHARPGAGPWGVGMSRPPASSGRGLMGWGWQHPPTGGRVGMRQQAPGRSWHWGELEETQYGVQTKLRNKGDNPGFHRSPGRMPHCSWQSTGSTGSDVKHGFVPLGQDTTPFFTLLPHVQSGDGSVYFEKRPGGLQEVIHVK